MQPFIFIIVAIVVVGLILLVCIQRSKRRLSSAARLHISKAWQTAMDYPDPERRILEADKVLDLALFKLGFTGSLGEKLKKAGPRFSNLDAVWAAHKLRNHIAHTPGVTVDERRAQQAIEALQRALKDLHAL